MIIIWIIIVILAMLRSVKEERFAYMKKCLSVYMNTILKFFLSIFFFIPFTTLLAQFNVDFSMSVQEGCVPLIVDFRNTSSIDTSKIQVSWNFGNGNQSVEKINTQAAYNSAGIYDIILTLDSSGVKKSKNYKLSVYDNPKVAFGVNVNSGCVPLEVNFVDSTTSNYNKIVSWTWNFGDGTGSNLQHPKNTFTAEALHNVTLVATDEKGCKSTLVKDNYIITTHQPIIDFNYSDTVSCVIPLNVKFTESIRSNYPYSIQWDFGNGQNSTSSQPSTNYQNEGSFLVKLTTTNNLGCKNELQKRVTIKKEDFQVKIVADSKKGCAPFKYKFKTESNFSITNYLWTVNNQTFTKASDSIIISQPGIYYVTLNVSDDKGCTKIVRDTIEVFEKPKVDFTLDKSSACIGPVAVNFTNLSSSDVITHAWTFSYSTNSSDKNPTKTFVRDGLYNVLYTGTNSNGCSESIRKIGVFEIKRPKVEISSTLEKGCVPFQTELTLNKTGEGEIKSIQWIYPDGSIINGHTNPLIEVNNEGTNDFKVIVEFEGSCPTQTITKSIIGGSLEPFTTVVNPNTVCVKQGVNGAINDPSLGTNYTWYMGDGTKYMSKNVSHDYNDIGNFQVAVVAERLGCKDSINIKKIEVVVPMASFAVTKLCNDGEFRFTNNSAGSQVNLWNFNDGNIIDKPEKTFVYKFDEKRIYDVKLYVENNATGCKDSIIVKVDNSNINNNIHFEPKNGCVPYVARFDITSNDYRAYSWKIGDTTFTTKSIQYLFNEPGKYDVTLSATRRDGCVERYQFDEIVTVTDLVADFELEPIGGCAPIDLTVRETSTSNYSQVVEWDWDMGGKSKSSDKIAFERFEVNQDETIRLIIKDDFGCKDTISKVVPIYIPKADFTTPTQSVCTDLDFNFASSSIGVALKYYWTIGDEEFLSNDSNPTFKFKDEGLYDVKLLVIDANNCRDSIEYKDYLKVENFQYDFDGFPRFKTCPELITNFNIFPHNVSYKSAFWDFGDGNQSLDTIKNPVNIYAESGIFDVSLYLEDYRGCKDTIVKQEFIEVKGPRGKISFSPTDGCLPLDIDFKASFTDSKFNFWDFGNGVGYLDNDLLEEMNYVYTEPGMVIPSLILDDGLGCVTQLHFDTIFVYGAKVKIETSDTGVCNGGEVEFKDVTQTNEHVPIINRNWQFSNGNVSTDLTSTQILNVDTTSYIKAILTIETGIGCVDSDSVEVKVYQYPQLQVASDLVMCKGDSIILNPSGAQNYSWEPKRYFQDNQSVSPKVSPLQDTWFKLIGYDTIACTSTDSILVKVVDGFDAYVGPDTNVCRGGEVQLFADLSEIHSGDYQYSWTIDEIEFSTVSNPLIVPEEDIAVVLNIKNGGCKEQNIPVFIGVSDLPEVVAYQDTTIAKGQSVVLNASSNQNVDFTWSPNHEISCINCINPVVTPKESTSYTVLATNDYGCTSEARVKIDIVDYCSQSYIQAPNVFSPNADGQNDEFRIYSDVDKVKFKSLRVYNRFGELIFTSLNETIGWDGYFNNVPVNSGVYVYFFEYDCYNGGSEIIKGNITLLR